MKIKRHMSANLKGLLNYYGSKPINILQDDNGRPLSNKEARAEIARLLALGHKKICCSNDCEGFDPFENGCPGHPIEDDE